MDMPSLDPSQLRVARLRGPAGPDRAPGNEPPPPPPPGIPGDAVYVTAAGWWQSRAQEASPFRAAFEALGGLLASGDLPSAQKAWEALSDRIQAQGATGEDPLAAAFGVIGEALGSGDLDGAKAAWQGLQAALQAMGRRPEGNLEAEVGRLGALLEQGDLEGAKTLVLGIQEHLQGRRRQPGPSDLAKGLAALGTALDAGDLAAAREAWATVRDQLAGPGRSGPGPLPPAFTALDTGGDGRVQAIELSCATEALKALDRNGDGVLTPEEYRPPKPPGEVAPPPRPPIDLALDIDGDGVIEADELAQAAERLNALDGNGDGVITAEEAQAGPGLPSSGSGEGVER